MRRWIILMCAGMWLGLGGGCQKEESREEEPGWRIALKPDKNPETMLEVRRELEAVMGEILGERVEVIVPLSGAVVLEGLGNGTLDAAYVSGMEYLQGRRRGVVEGLLVNEIKGRTYYESCWVVRVDSPYQTVEDLQGKEVCFASRTSTSGYILPMADLVRRGRLRPGGAAEEFFGEGKVYYGTGYVSAIERLLNGQVEAAAVSDYVMDGDKHLSEEQKRRLRVLARQGPVPTHVMVVRKDLPIKAKQKLKEALLEMNEERCVGLRDRAFTSKWVEIDTDEHVKSLEEDLGRIGLQP